MPTKAPTFKPPGGQTKQRQQRKVDKQRPNAAKRGYDRGWHIIREEQLAREPLCRECKKKGKIVAATCVDHINPVSGPDDPKFRDPNNLQSLCTPCHSKKTAKEDGGFGNVKNRKGEGV